MDTPSTRPDKDAVANKLPPQNIDAEESIISAVLLDNSTLSDIMDVVSPADFYRTAHQKIFEGITELFQRGEPVDLVTLADFLQSKNLLEKTGGAVYLAKLVDTAPVPSNARYYAKIIHDKASLRRLITAASHITSRCFDLTSQVDDIIDYAEKVIFEVTTHKTRESVSPICDLIDKNIDVLIERQGNRTLISGVPTGFSRLDSLTSGFQNSDLIILAARPGMGKTALSLNIARNAAVSAGVPVVFFSLEMSKEQLSMRLLCSEARLDFSKLRDGRFDSEQWEKLTEAASTLSNAPIYIDDSAEMTSLDIKTKCRRLKMEKNIGLVVIDYIQLMKPRRHLERRDLEISDISRSLKSLAKELDIPIVGLSQLNRMLESRSDKRPQLSDLRESGALEQDADLVIFIYRDEVYNKEENNPKKGIAEIHLAKQRNGPVGIQELMFLNQYTRFENIAFGFDAYSSETDGRMN